MLHDGFLRSADLQPEAPALFVDGRFLSYGELRDDALRVAWALLAFREQGVDRCLLFGYRSAEVYGGLLGTLIAGMAYVPLNPQFPAMRNLSILDRSECAVMLVDVVCERHLAAILNGAERSLTILFLHAADCAHYRRAYTRHRFNTVTSVGDYGRREETSRPGTELAYILFTSGTTGEPKGVPIRHESASRYIESIASLYPASRDARFTQLFDLTFDLSVHDLFVCWQSGGCLYVVPASEALQPGDFVRQHEITHWFSVPSTAAFLQQFRKLRPNAFPSIQMSMFCGETLPMDLARAWLQAAPGSRLVNLYGPTEATIAFTHFELKRTDAAELSLSTAPIGWPLPMQEVQVVDDNTQAVTTGATGELLLGGSQLSPGYISVSENDKHKFFTARFPGKRAQRWYRTGDIANKSAEYGLLFHGRRDNQIKFRGYRVELQEVEYAIRVHCGAALCAVIPWPLDGHGAPLGLVAFACGDEIPKQEVILRCKALLPDYMVPGDVRWVPSMPLNANGKIDRVALMTLCESSETTFI